MQRADAFARPTYAISSVDHALRLIQLLRDTGSLRVSEAATELAIAPSTAHRLLSMLVYRGFAAQDESRAYAPGPALGAPTRDQGMRQLRDRCVPHLEQLAQDLGESVNLTYRHGTTVRFLASVEATTPWRVGDRTGAVLEARRSSGGKALLAAASVESLAALYRSPAAARAGVALDERAFAALVRELDAVRREGWAHNDGESEAGVSALGVPVRGDDGRPVVAVSIAVPVERAAALAEPRVRERLLEARGAMEASIRSLPVAAPR